MTGAAGGAAPVSVVAFKNLGRKSHWLTEATIPAEKGKDKAMRALEDLPADVTPGARQVAMVTMHRSAQAELLEPIVTALRELEALPDWSGGFLVIDNIRRTWRDAPFKRYASFADFYQQELATTWGQWSELQATYSSYMAGELTTAQVEARLRKTGRPPKSDGKGDNITFKGRGTSRAYIVARLDRDGQDELAAAVRAHKISAIAAARRAGFRVDTPLLVIVRRAWRRMTPEDRATFRAEIAS
jgi:hypothetical protein